MISIIATSYNTSPWIEKCLDSLINQTYKDIEIIVVNDCSTDDTRDKILKYVEKDSRVKLLDNKENVGAGLSRRYGIAASKGEFISLIDTDDWIDVDFLEKLWKVEQETDADVIEGGVTIHRGEEATVIPVCAPFIGEGSLIQGRLTFLNNKIIKRKFYEIVPYSDLRLYEDADTVLRLGYYVHSKANAETDGYHYLMRSSSLSHEKNPARSLYYNALVSIRNYLFYENKEHPFYKKECSFKSVLSKIDDLFFNNIDTRKLG